MEMAEYIGLGTAISKLTALEVIDPNATLADARRLLADMPGADVAPVVRCKDCKQYRVYMGRDMCAKDAVVIAGNEVGLRATAKDNFCSYGERKDGSDGPASV